MNFEKMVRAWKDDEYRRSLSDDELAQLPENPVGELSDEDLETIYGAWHHGKHGGGGYVNTNALLCVQSVLIYCFTINGNCGNAG